MAKPLNVDRYLTRRWAYGTTPLVYYVRPAGSDNNDGLSPATAFATLEWALHWMSIAEVNQSVVIDVTGMTVSGNSVLNLGGTTLGGLNFDLDLTATAPNNFFSKAHRQIRSDLSLVQALNVTGQAFDAVSGILTLTVADALVANALRGRFAVGSVLGEYGTIRSNTGGAGPNTIEVCNILGLTAPVSAYAPGATLTFGDAGNFFEQAIYLLALCDWNLQGLTIASNGPKAASLSIYGAAPVHLTLCSIDGIQISNRAQTTIDGCYVHSHTFAQDGGSISATQTLFRSLNWLCHGSGASGLNEFVGCCFDASTAAAFGGGNVESAYNFGVENSEFDSAAQSAVQAIGGVSRLNNCVVSNSASSGIVAQDNAVLTLNNVQGTGNANYGVEAYYGAMVKRAGGTAVTGGIDDVFAGAIGAVAWAATPVTDLDQLVRVGV
jgi:hypothetical protein